MGHEPGKNFQDLVDQIVVLYPPLYPQEKSDQSGGGKNSAQSVKTRELEETVYKRLNGGFWNREQRSHYFNLTAIQKIKRNILRDKLFLCQQGIKIFPVLSSDQEVKTGLENQLWKFILLRCLILARARAYVDRLGDHQDIFTNNQDVGLLHPRPSARRRREQDLYNVHLSDRCKDIGREMNLLMKRLIKSNDPKPQLIFHHWQHNFSSSSFSFMDELEDPMTPNQHYIKTSYWMPERPDLQSEIAHEVAHSVIREWLGNLSWQALDSSTESDFCLLLKQLDQCCAIFEVEKYSAMNLPRQEIAADLLATAVAGPAYLHALFLELLGYGLEDMFAINESDQFEVGLINYLESVIGSYSHIRDWYYRLHLVCTWLEAIDETDTKGALCQRLIDACRKILEGLHNFLELNTPPKDKYGDYWRTLTERLCEIVRKSDVVFKVKTWRKERREDHRSEIDHGWKKGERKFPRFTRPLHPRLRNFLFEGFIGKKIALIQKIELPDEKIKCHEQIKDVYKLQINKNLKDYLNKRSSLADDPVPLICESLFEQIYDIPWQCAFLRGLDFVNPKSHIAILYRL